MRNFTTFSCVIFLMNLVMLAGNVAKAADEGLVNFSVTPAGDHAEIKWSTRGVSHDYFIVEKSIDGKTFEETERVTCNYELTVIEAAYAVTDFSPFAGRSYYRVKQVFKDGSFRHSKMAVLIFDGETEFRFELFPTRSSGNFSLSFKGVSNPDEVVNVDIVTLRGRVVISVNARLRDLDGHQMFFENTTQILTAGTYIVKSSVAGRQYHQRLVIE